MVITQEIHLDTHGHCDIQDITPQVAGAVEDAGMRAGIVTIFCPGSTGGLTTIEYESGALADLQQVFDEIAPPDRDYRHHLRWRDDNGHSHAGHVAADRVSRFRHPYQVAAAGGAGDGGVEAPCRGFQKADGDLITADGGYLRPPHLRL